MSCASFSRSSSILPGLCGRECPLKNDSKRGQKDPHLMDCRSSRHMSLRFVTVLFVLGVPLCAAPGIKNFDRVDARVYRGGPPTEEGFRYLSQLGVKMI